MNCLVRFNGGHQVGHTVVKDDYKHVFSNFGSGTLHSIPTYWSKFCTVHPFGLVNEYKLLKENVIKPILYIDPLCPVTTPFDIYRNQNLESVNNHGSVGVGFGTTIERHMNSHYRLYAMDLLHKDVLDFKLKEIAKYYNNGNLLEFCINKINEFKQDVEAMLAIPTVYIKKVNIVKFKNIVFEGGQGILLDQDHGFFPHVTRSNTTSKNAFEILNDFGIKDKEITIHYVTRTYLTRHGYGPLPFENHKSLESFNFNENETNKTNEWQKEFRKAPLNIDLLEYAIRCDENYYPTNNNVFQQMVYTCYDQASEELPLVINGYLTKTNKRKLYKALQSINSAIYIDKE